MEVKERKKKTEMEIRKRKERKRSGLFGGFSDRRRVVNK